MILYKKDKMHNVGIYRICGIALFCFLIIGSVNSKDALINLAFERFKTNLNVTNKHAYGMIYTPPDLNSEKLKQHNIKSWWSKRRLTWLLKNHPPTLTIEQTLGAFERAFFLWSNHTSLVFKPICIYYHFNNPKAAKKCIDLSSYNNNQKHNRLPDITIEFSKYQEHDQICQFKFIDSTLAHAFYPEKGIIHFNMDKNWSVNDVRFVSMIQSNIQYHYTKSSDYQYNLITVGWYFQSHLFRKNKFRN
jgi:hypothetical protein